MVAHHMNMDIPAVFASYSDGSLVASEAWFRGTLPETYGRTVGFSKAVSGISDADSRMPAVVVDADSLGRRFFTEGVLKNMRVRGADIWYMTWIETVEDVFDSFNTNADVVMGPYHASLSDDELRDILDVSDSFIPVVYSIRGKAVGRHGRMRDLQGTVSSLHMMGYPKVCILDTDGKVAGYDWELISEDHPSDIGFTKGPGCLMNVIRPIVL